MLTCVNTVPEATKVDFPPLEDSAPYEAAVRAGHSRYVFAADNEVLYFRDEQMPNGYVVNDSITSCV
jgi:hypothetical protein